MTSQRASSPAFSCVSHTIFLQEWAWRGGCWGGVGGTRQDVRVFRYSKSIFEHHIQNHKNTRTIPNWPFCARFSEGTVLLLNAGPFIFLCIWQKPSLACSSYKITNWSLTYRNVHSGTVKQRATQSAQQWKLSALSHVPTNAKATKKALWGWLRLFDLANLTVATWHFLRFPSSVHGELKIRQNM